ncbi:hypothetical protein Tco_1082322 [Tanacetum coccineum]|uniref:Uncharacterized protein n=1 Tax=Tanacetum coccineum TaxID=301880 RepID=A0ABQ5I1R9_9ASTR
MAMFIETTFKSTFHKLLPTNFNQRNTISRPSDGCEPNPTPGFFLRSRTMKTVGQLRFKKNFKPKSDEPISIKTVEITSTKDKFINLQLVNHQFTKLTLIKLPLRKCKVFQRPILRIMSRLTDAIKENAKIKDKVYKTDDKFNEMLSNSKFLIPFFSRSVFPTNNGITEDIQPPVVPVENQNLVSEPVVAPVSAPLPNPKPSIPYPSRRNDEKRRENANEQIEKFYEIFKNDSFEIRRHDALTLMP